MNTVFGKTFTCFTELKHLDVLDGLGKPALKFNLLYAQYALHKTYRQNTYLIRRNKRRKDYP